MEFISILNDVLGPVMRGPSSSHTAGSYHIGRIARSLLGEKPLSSSFTFDSKGSYVKTYREQGADLAFAAGIMEWPITDLRFVQALEIAAEQRIKIRFQEAPLKTADHPNTVKIEMISMRGKRLSAVAKSIGGGRIVFSELEGWPVHLDGKSHEVLVLCKRSAEEPVVKILGADKQVSSLPVSQHQGDEALIYAERFYPIDSKLRAQVELTSGVKRLWAASPIFYMKRGETIFSSAEEMVHLAEQRKCSLGEIALSYESQLLGLSENEVLAEIIRRFGIMKQAVIQGLEEKGLWMQLLHPTAHKIFQADQEGKLAIGGIHARVAARAMAALHVSNSMGIVCAAPTGGSAGVIPGVVVTVAEEKKISDKESALALLGASAVGLIIARRATFAAEVAGCQVEIGAAGAMAAAAVIEVAHGSAQQALDAAAISLQNTMGSVCDLVQGICEIPCHTRNAVAASSAFVCADLILGGYHNPIPLDETIDAVFASGKMLPSELRCTSLGGLAVTPSALSLPRLRYNKKS
jgi:L-serine dehydratase